MAYAIEFRNRVLKALLKFDLILLSKKQIYDLADEPRQRLYRKLKVERDIEFVLVIIE
jgi:hypothetical protein